MNPLLSYVLRQTGNAISLYGVSFLINRLNPNAAATAAAAAQQQPQRFVPGIATVALGTLAAHPIETASNVGRTVGRLTGTFSSERSQMEELLRAASSGFDTLQRQITNVANDQVTLSDIDVAFAAQREHLDSSLHAVIQQQFSFFAKRQSVLLGTTVIVAAVTTILAFKAHKCPPISTDLISADTADKTHEALLNTVSAFEKALDKHEAKVALARAAYWGTVAYNAFLVVGVLVVIGGVLYLMYTVVNRRPGSNDRFQRS